MNKTYQYIDDFSSGVFENCLVQNSKLVPYIYDVAPTLTAKIDCSNAVDDIAQDERYYYIATAGNILIVRKSDFAVEQSLSAGYPVGKLTISGEYLYVATISTYTILQKWNLNTRTKVAESNSIEMYAGPRSIIVDSTNGFVYFQTDSYIAKININDFSVITKISLSTSELFMQDANYLYAIVSDNTAHVQSIKKISKSSLTVTSSIVIANENSESYFNLLVATDENCLYVVLGTKLLKLDLLNFTLLDSVNFGSDVSGYGDSLCVAGENIYLVTNQLPLKIIKINKHTLDIQQETAMLGYNWANSAIIDNCNLLIGTRIGPYALLKVKLQSIINTATHITELNIAQNATVIDTLASWIEAEPAGSTVTVEIAFSENDGNSFGEYQELMNGAGIQYLLEGTSLNNLHCKIKKTIMTTGDIQAQIEPIKLTINAKEKVSAFLMDYLPKYYHESRQMLAIMYVEEQEIIKLNASIQDLLDQFFIETATWGLAYWERIAGITTDTSKSYAERRQAILDKRKGFKMCTKVLLKNVVESYDSSIEVIIKNAPEEYAFYVIFTNPSGVPPYLSDIKEKVELLKPAHLEAVYFLQSEYPFNEITWDALYENNVAWDEIESKNLTWDQLETYGWM